MHEWPDSLGTPPDEFNEFTHINHGVMNYTLLLVRSDAVVTALLDKLREQEQVIRDLEARDKYNHFATAQCRKMVEFAANQYNSLERTAPELIEDWRQAVIAEEAADDEA